MENFKVQTTTEKDITTIVSLQEAKKIVRKEPFFIPFEVTTQKIVVIGKYQHVADGKIIKVKVID